MQIDILGKLDYSTKKDLNLEIEKEYFFIGYTFYEYKINSQFITDDGNILTLIKCFPDGAFEYDVIPYGYKSICEFYLTKPLLISEIQSWVRGTNSIIAKYIG